MTSPPPPRRRYKDDTPAVAEVKPASVYGLALRGLVLVWFVVEAARQLRSHDFEGGILHGVLFGVHELGHLVLAITGGEVITAFAGSLFQVLLPIGCAALMAHRRDWFGVAICGCLLATSLGEVGVYISDARAESLDLVSMSAEGQTHDWNFLLERWHLLKQDVAIARAVKKAGWLVLSGSMVLAVADLRRLWRGTAPAAG